MDLEYAYFPEIIWLMSLWHICNLGESEIKCRAATHSTNPFIASFHSDVHAVVVDRKVVDSATSIKLGAGVKGFPYKLIKT